MLTPEEKRAAHEEAKEWANFLEWFDELYEFSFKEHRYTKGTALQIYLMANCVPPSKDPLDDDDGKDKWKKP